MRISKGWRAAALAFALAFAGLGVDPAASQAPAPPAAGCEPFLGATINGDPPESVAPPDGRTSADELRFDVRAGFDGLTCDEALNSPPVLLGAWVDPSLTRVTASFRYRVTYVDVDNDPPVSITALLDGGRARPMVPVDPADQDYRDGVLYEAWYGVEFVGDVLVPDAMGGDHWALVEAHDGRRPAAPALVVGPRLHDDVAGSLLLPNPTNRLFIHPIANGPTFTPPSEVLPPPGPIVGAADGVYSHSFPVDPVAGQVGARWTVGTGSALRLQGYGLLEGEPGPENGFALFGSAALDPRSHAGDQAVNLAPGPLDAGGGTATLRAFPNSETYRFALVGAVRLYVNHTATSPAAPAPLDVWMELDRDRDGTGDVCVGTNIDVPPTGGWTRFALTRGSPMRVHDERCAVDVTPDDPGDGTTTLNDLQDNPVWGVLPVVALRIDGPSAVGTGTAWSADDALLVDSLALIHGTPNTVGDVDACLYGSAADPPSSPLQPLACQSDIGPNSAPVPEGATRANVWADQMLPVISTDTFVPRRPYLEPLAFSFTYSNSVPEGPAFEVPGGPQGRLFLSPDEDADGVPDAGPQPLWESGPLPLVGPHQVNFSVPFSGPDAVYRYVLAYETGRAGESLALPLAVQRFVNDEPTATLSATQEKKHRTATLSLAASDPDEGQGTVAQRLGGLRAWTLSFGDGERVGGEAPLPASVEHAYQRPGSYPATLTVEDADGMLAEATVDLVFGRGRRAS